MSFRKSLFLFSIPLLLNLFSCTDDPVQPEPGITITQITNIEAGVYEAKLTPDRSKVIYSFTENNGGNYEIRIYEIDGGKERQLIKMDNIQYFAISGDETKLAFRNYPSPGLPSLYLLDLVSNDLTKLHQQETLSDTSYSPIAFSNDNSKILLFVNFPVGSAGYYDIQEDKFVHLPVEPGSVPISFSPSGNEILYYNSSTTELGIINPDGSSIRPLLEGYIISIYNTFFSPDGSSVFFSTLSSGDRNIYKVSIDGSDIDTLTNDAFDNQLNDISPDGKSILYTSYRSKSGHWDYDIFINTEGSDKVIVNSRNNDEGIGFTNIPGKVIFKSFDDFLFRNNLYLAEY